MMNMRVNDFKHEITPMDLAKHAAGYRYNAEKFEKLENALFKKIRAFDPVYGKYLKDHLDKTSEQLALVLKARGLKDEDVINIQRAFMLHDVGKIAQDVGLWQLSLEKPSDATKLKRSEHVHLARGVIEETIEELGLDFFDPYDTAHLETIYYMAKAHHERLNGRGPLGWTGDDLDPVLRIATIIDEIDGKLKTNETLTMSVLFKAIRDPDKFDLELITFCENVLANEAEVEPAQTPPAAAPQACALTPS